MNTLARAAKLAAMTLAGSALVVCAVVGAGRAGPAATNDAATAPPAPGVAASGRSGHDLDAQQIATPTPPSASAAAAAQLTAPGHGAAQSQVGSAAAGRNTRVTAVGGHDRCDPGAPAPHPADCDNILDRRADEFAGENVDRTPTTVDPNAASSDLVNGIVSGGTGTVVQLPPK